MKTCPFCAEKIQDQAITCKFCNQELQPLPVDNSNADKQPESTTPMPDWVRYLLYTFAGIAVGIVWIAISWAFPMMGTFANALLGIVAISLLVTKWVRVEFGILGGMPAVLGLIAGIGGWWEDIKEEERKEKIRLEQALEKKAANEKIITTLKQAETYFRNGQYSSALPLYRVLSEYNKLEGNHIEHYGDASYEVAMSDVSPERRLRLLTTAMAQASEQRRERAKAHVPEVLSVLIKDDVEKASSAAAKQDYFNAAKYCSTAQSRIKTALKIDPKSATARKDRAKTKTACNRIFKRAAREEALALERGATEKLKEATELAQYGKSEAILTLEICTEAQAMIRKAVDTDPSLRSAKKAATQIRQKCKSISRQLEEIVRKEKAAKEQQDRFIELVSRFENEYRDAPNELKKSKVRTRRRHALSQLFGRNRWVENWTGTLKTMGTTSKRHAYITIKLDGSDIEIKTWNNSLSDINDQTLIKEGSHLYDKVSEFAKGNKVHFTGRFPPSSDDWIGEGSMTEIGSMTDPEFLMRFSDISIVSH